jgi:DNA-binding CsgD family transcriptional regulator
MKDLAIDPRSERMLELLSQGASSRDVAASLGYQEGTMRVYLHHLYRKIGVANKTEAVVWYLRRGDAPPAPASKAISLDRSPDLFGEMALEEDLFTALGAMGRLVGPYSRIWEVALRLKGGEVDGEAQARRDRSRGLWRTLLKGDWAHAKRMHDADFGASLLLDAPGDAVMLACALLLGGYSSAGERLASQLSNKRRGGPGASPRELAILRALESASRGKDEGLATLRDLLGEKGTQPVLKQMAGALVFHVLRARKDENGAREAANGLWVEAESARRELEAMGERPFGVRKAAAGAAKSAPRRAAAREKAAAR